MLDRRLLTVALAASIVAAPLAWAQTVPADATLPEVAALGHKVDYPVDLASDGDVVVATKRNHFDGTSGSPFVERRRAHVMRRSAAGAWSEEIELSTLLPIGSKFDTQIVTVEGNTVAARLDSTATPIAIFERVGGVWSHVTNLANPSGLSSHRIVALELEGGRLFACEAELASSSHGAVFQLVYEHSPSGWQLVARSELAAPHGAYVSSMDADGERVSIARVHPTIGYVVDVSVHSRAPNGTWNESHSETAFSPSSASNNAHLDGDRLCMFEVVGSALVLKEAILATPSPLVFATVATFAPPLPFEARFEVGVEDGFAVVAYESADDTTPGRAVVLERRASGAWIPFAEFSPGAGAPTRKVRLDGRRLVFETGSVVQSVHQDNDVAVFDFGTLLRGAREVSIAAQGVQPLYLRGGFERSGWTYLVLGSLSGTAPATPLGFGLELPLVVDAYTQMTLALRAPLTGGFGTLDTDGRAAASFFAPPGLSPSFAGLSVHHAYVAVDSVTFEAHASNAVRVDLVN